MGFREREKGRLARLKSKLFSAEKCEHEMEADVVSLLHIAPAANREFVGRVTSPGLRSVGFDIHDVWASW